MSGGLLDRSVYSMRRLAIVATPSVTLRVGVGIGAQENIVKNNAGLIAYG